MSEKVVFQVFINNSNSNNNNNNNNNNGRQVTNNNGNNNGGLSNNTNKNAGEQDDMESASAMPKFSKNEDKVGSDVEAGQGRQEDITAEIMLDCIPVDIKEKLERLPPMVVNIWADNSDLQLEATVEFRTFLDDKYNHPIDQELIQATVVPRLIEFLSKDDFPQLQSEAITALAQIVCATTDDNDKAIILQEAIPIFVKLVGSSNNDVLQTAVQELGKIAEDSTGGCDLILGHRALSALQAQLNEHPERSMLEAAAIALKVFCYNSRSDQIKLVIPVLGWLLQYSNDTVILHNATIGLNYLSERQIDDNKALIEADVCGWLLKLLVHSSSSVVESAIDTIKNMAKGSDMQLQVVIDANIVGPLIHIIQTLDSNSVKAAGTIRVLICHANLKQIKNVVSQGCISHLCDLIDSNTFVMWDCLQALESILRAGEAEKYLGKTGGVNRYAEMINNSGGLKKIKNLGSPKAEEILKTYWPSVKADVLMSKDSIPSSTIKKKREQLPLEVSAIWSNDNSQRIEATTQLKKLCNGNPLIEELIQASVIPRLVEFLSKDNFPQLQSEAISALTRIGKLTSEDNKVVIYHEAIPKFIKLLDSRDDVVREQAVCALDAIISDSYSWGQVILIHEAVPSLLSLLNKHPTLSMLRKATKTLSRIRNGKGFVQYFKPALKTLGWLLQQCDDEEALINATSVLEALSSNVQAVIEAGGCVWLVELLGHPCSSVLIPAINTVLNMVKGHNRQRQAVFEANIISSLVDLLQYANFEVRKVAASTIETTTSCSSCQQIRYLVSRGCIKPLYDVLECSDGVILVPCLKALRDILEVGEKDKHLGKNGGVNPYAKMIEDTKGLEKIKNLEDNDHVRSWAGDILKKFWSEDEE